MPSPDASLGNARPFSIRTRLVAIASSCGMYSSQAVRHRANQRYVQFHQEMRRHA